MISKLKRVRHWIVTYKIYYLRASSYMQMLLFTAVLYKQCGWQLRYLFIGYPLIITITILIGWLDNKFKFHHAEMLQLGLRHPILKWIYDSVRRIERKLNEVERVL